MSPSLASTARYQLDPKELGMIEAVARFQLLTAGQITRLFRFSPASQKWVGKRLARLVGHQHLIGRRLRGQPLAGGTFPLFYGLGPAGHAALASLGMLSGRYRGAAFGTYSAMHVEHTLAANDVVIAAHRLDHAAVRLDRFQTEAELKRTPRRVTLTDGTTSTVTPDALLEFHVTRAGKVLRARVAVEVDLGSEHQARWQDKVRKLLAAYGDDRLFIAVLATREPRRAAVLRSWTEAELSQRKQTANADLFLFASADPGTVEPSQLFLAPIWSEPFQRQPLPLLDLSEAE